MVSFCEGDILLREFQSAEGRGKGSPYHSAGLHSQGQLSSALPLQQPSLPLSLSLCLYVFIFLSCRTTVSAFCSLLMWLVMSSFSFAVPYVPPFPLDWSSLFNLLLYPPNSINSFSEFLFLPHRKPLIVRGECVFAWPLDSCSIQNLSPGVRGIPQFIAFFLCHGKS